MAFGAWAMFFFFFSSRRRHTRSLRDWSSDVCSSDLHRVASTAGCVRPAEEPGEHHRLGDRGVLVLVEQDHFVLGPLQDRKSTRLNSSHVEISYAVFCLKKKKKKT